MKILEDLTALGWRLVDTAKGVLAFPPDSSFSPVLVHWTPSDHRAWPNLMAALRRSGYDTMGQ
jgi:hypothetical protein